MSTKNIRNFCIIAHIDHGKSTLADRFLEVTKTIQPGKMREQYLDRMDLERERGITIKLAPVTMEYKAKDGNEYTLNLIDTPGHVDFSYEVSRSLAACEGALLLVDASQGVEAQTVAHYFVAVQQGLKIFPVLNKIDLFNADSERCVREIEDVLALPADDILKVSAKEGTGVEEVLERIVRECPPPGDHEDMALRALIFDSQFNTYRGVVLFIRVKEGKLKPGLKIKLMASAQEYEVEEVGVFKPDMLKKDALFCGDVGYLIANIKKISDVEVGDTITTWEKPAKELLPGYKKVKSMVFCGLYPVEPREFPNLRDALEKLELNDASLVYEPESSAALGQGFRCGFLGLLHLEIVQERLEREFGLNLIATAPSVVFRVTTRDGKIMTIDNPSKFPNAGIIEKIEEPYIATKLMLPEDFTGNVMQLAQERRGILENMEYIGQKRVLLTYLLPLSEVIFDFYDRLKSISRGYASMDYELHGYRESDLVKMDILVAGDVVDALSIIVHNDFAHARGKALVEKLRKVIPRQLFEVAIQAAIGGKIIARENIKALRKNVLAKCYGGDVTRKRKLLEKQKEGKRRMKQVGRVEIPQEAFLAVLKVGSEEK